MALWSNTDEAAGKPKYLSDAEKALTFGMNTTEITAGGDNVTAVGVALSGTGYLEVPGVAFSGGGGSSAAATASIAGGSVTAIAVTNTGTGYTSAPTVSIDVPRRTIPTANVSIGVDQINYSTHGLVAGEEVKYYHGGGTALAGLTNNTSYYVSALGLSGNTFRLAASEGASALRTALGTLAIAGTAGQFTCAATTLAAGDRVVITGTLTGTGTITGYATGTIYKVSAVTGTSPSVTGFTLTDESGSALTTTAGTAVGLTARAATLVDLTGTGNNAQYFDLVDQVTATAVADLGYTSAGSSATHAGWVLRTVGTGGRAGRVFTETLVAMGSMTSDASDDTVLPDA